MSAGAEDILQMQVMRTLAITAPQLVGFAIPNGGYRHPREAKKLKDMGVRPGVADLGFLLSEGRTGWIELKAGKGRQQPEQKQFQAECEATGAPYAVCRSVEEVESTLRAWGVTLRSRSPE